MNNKINYSISLHKGIIHSQIQKKKKKNFWLVILFFSHFYVFFLSLVSFFYYIVYYYVYYFFILFFYLSVFFQPQYYFTLSNHFGLFVSLLLNLARAKSDQVILYCCTLSFTPYTPSLYEKTKVFCEKDILECKF